MIPVAGMIVTDLRNRNGSCHPVIWRVAWPYFVPGEGHNRWVLYYLVIPHVVQFVSKILVKTEGLILCDFWEVIYFINKQS